MVKANLMAAIRNNTNGNVYNCASGIKVTVHELYRNVCDILGSKDHPTEYRDWMPGDT